MKMNFFSLLIINVLIGFSVLCAQNKIMPSYETEAKIVVNNTILAKIMDKTITTYDIKKKLDYAFNNSYPDLVDSTPARFQFYLSGWKHTLDELVNNQLVLMEANKKELKVTDAEIREEMQQRFGPNVMANLDKLKISYEDALKLIKEEMIIQRMMYYFIKIKADQKITPSAIKSAYRLYCKENPPKETWSYHVISIKSKDDAITQQAAKKALDLFKEKGVAPQELEDSIKDLEKSFSDCQISISNLYQVSNKEIDPAQQKILSILKKNTYSDIIYQTSRSSNKKNTRIFYLKDYEKKDTETFEEISNKLKENLLNTALIEESQKYFARLQEEYHIDKNLNIPEDFVPFSIEQ